MQQADLGRLGAGDEGFLEVRGQPGTATLPVSRSMSTNTSPSGASNDTFGRPASARIMKRSRWAAPPECRSGRAAVVVEPDPDHGQQLRREPDEPGIAQIVRRARLAGGVQREAGGAGPAPVPSLMTLRIMLVTRNVVSGRAMFSAGRDLQRHVLPAVDDLARWHAAA